MNISPALKWLKSLPLHPLYFAVVPILMFYAMAGIVEQTDDVLLIPLAAALVFAFGLYGLVLLCLRDVHKSAIIATSFWLFFYSVTVMMLINEQLTLRHHGPPFWVNILIVGGTWLAILSMAVFTLITRKPIARLTSWLNQTGLFLLALELLVVLVPAAEVRFFEYPRLVHAFPRNDERAGCPVNQRPDVYYIVVDEMTSPNNLKKYFGYDNSAYLKQLESRGFYVPANSRSNYSMTRPCLASDLNIAYINDVGSVAGPKTKGWVLLGDMIRDSKVARIMKNLGYRYIHIGSALGPTWYNPCADKNILESPVAFFSESMFEDSILCLFPSTFAFFNNDWRHQKLAMFNSLNSLPPGRQPKFVFAHIVMPHEPFLFGANGEPVKYTYDVEDGKWGPRMKSGYVMQVQFTEKRLLDTVEKILKASKTQPIIIIQGDHGSNSSGSLFDAHLSNELVNERTGIFNAYLVPPNCRTLLYDTITPVNSFRMVFKGVFGMPFERLEDRSYVSNYREPFAFMPVTNRISLR